MRSPITDQHENWSGIGMMAILVSIGVSGFVIPLVSGEEGYTQGWMGAPDWVLARIDTSYLPDLFIPRNLDEDREEIPGVSDLIAEGNSLLSGGSYAEAKRKFEQGINLNGNSFDAWLGRGIALEELNRSQTAEYSFDRAISLSGEKNHAWAAYAGKGRVLLELRRYQEAAAAFTTAISRFDGITGSDEDLAGLYIGLAQAEERRGNIPEASQAVDMAEGLLGRENAELSPLK